MSQAEELLNSLSEDFPIHAHPLVDSDKYFIIDPVTRTIANPIGRPLTLMQRDHNSTVYTFQLPRYIDGHDMLLCNRVKCHFNNIENGENEGEFIEHPDVAELTDLRVNPEDRESVICSWTITRQATWYVGALGFFLQYLCVDNAGNETYEWHTDGFTDITIKKTEHNDEAAILEYTAVFEQWRERIFGAGNSVKNELIALTEQKLEAIDAEGVAQVAAVANEGLRVLDTIPEDYTAMSAQVDINKRFSAPVIVQETEGENVIIKDSAKMPVLGLQMFGKSEQKKTNGYQLCDMSRFPDFTAGSTTSTVNENGTTTVTGGGITVTNNDDGSLTISGNGEVTSLFSARFDLTHEEMLKLLKAGDLYCNYGAMTLPPLYIQLNNRSGTLASMNNKYSDRASMTIAQEMLDDEESFLRFSFYQVAGDVVSSGTIKPMLYQDGDGTWEPFSGGKPSPNPEYPQEIKSVENPTINIFGENLLDAHKYIEVGYTNTLNGVTVNVFDGVVHVYGTNEMSNYAVPLTVDIPVDERITFPAGTYSSHPGLTMSFYNENANPQWKNRAGTFVLDEPHELKSFYIAVDPNATVDNYVALAFVHGSKVPSVYDYVKSETMQSVDTNVVLQGIPVESGGNYTDENGQQYIANYRDWERGVDVQRVRCKVFDGTQTLYNNWFPIMVYNIESSDLYAVPGSALLCNYFRNVYVGNAEGSTLAIGHLDDYGYTDVSEVQALMLQKYEEGDPVVIHYALKKPIETPIPEAELQAYRELHTNYPNTTILNDSGAYMKVTYGTDTKMYIDKKIEELRTIIADNS